MDSALHSQVGREDEARERVAEAHVNVRHKHRRRHEAQVARERVEVQRVNAGMTQLVLSGAKVLDLPDELLGIVGLFAGPTDGGFSWASRRCLKVTESACERLARTRYPPWVIARGVVSSGAEEMPSAWKAAVTTALLDMKAAREALKFELKEGDRFLCPAVHDNVTKLRSRFHSSLEHASKLLADVGYVYTSWRHLIVDDARLIGLWCLDVQGVSRPTRSPLCASGGYEGRILRIAFDAFTGELTAVVEAYGEADLREAHLSALVLDNGKSLNAYRTDYSLPNGDRAPGGLQAKYILRGSKHQVCRMTFAVKHERRRWDFTNTLSFQYGAEWAWEPMPGETEPQDYQASEFLRKDLDQTWAAAFSGPGPLPDGASRRRFVPRGPLAFPKAERKPRSEWV